jgi:hypothetical protein
MLALLLVFLVVRHRGTLVDRSLPVYGAGGKENGFGQAGLSGATVAEHSYIPDFCGVYSGHATAPLVKDFSNVIWNASAKGCHCELLQPNAIILSRFSGEESSATSRRSPFSRRKARQK